MEQTTFMDKIRSFFGFGLEPPKNDFRNPIWGSDDDDDGDELYTRDQITAFNPHDFHQEVAKQMNDVFKTFGNLLGDVKSFFNDEQFGQFDNFAGFGDIPSESDNFDSNSIRNYYLKPGYHKQKTEHPEDMDLDGKISSNEISGLFNQKEDKKVGTIMPFNGDLVPGRSFCKTVITTSITKPDGTIETRRIVKNGKEVVEETITSTEPTNRGPYNTGFDTVRNPGIIYSNVMSELSSLFKNFY
ncbi:uncharacterized protein LOC106133115 [Amyelois transitella]|uniref:uncharacterized protein LOC106133115 n=1 Tax=Amyelois transitella TaxID=680683 RepID=UPI00299037C4|nr:uncharacterized protein LOC106133115 [Amyelois transitella]